MRKSMSGFIDYWFKDYFRFIGLFFSHLAKKYLAVIFGKFEFVKGLAVVKMYSQRGKYAQFFVHAGLVAVMGLGVTIGPSLIVDTTQTRAMISSALGGRIVFAEDKSLEATSSGDIPAQAFLPLTQVSDKPRSEDISYSVESGDTFQSIADKFGVSVDTLKWANPNSASEKKLKPGDKLTIPPVTGVEVTVKAGETIYSIAKRYGADAQSIVDFPFNAFTNDETFALAVGQKLIIPDGIMPKADQIAAIPIIARTPDAGTVTATGNWIWPAKGVITQGFRPWHKAADIANHDGGPILAADAGTVILVGWDTTGYGNRVVINHGNGFMTLYAHMSRFDVVAGQRVKRGDQLGMMGSTGHSTGMHLHFEIRTTKGNLDPLAQLR